LSNLDAKLRVETRANISKLHQQLSTTFIYVTHDQMEAMTMATRIAVINKGLLQQVDTPQTLYDNPDNLFVAGFIGTPAMNFVKSRLQKSDGKLIVDSGAFKVEVPSDRVGAFSNFVGRDVIMGIRPENIHDPHFVPTGIFTQSVEGKVELTELMGNEIFLYISCGEHNLVARVDPRTAVRMGDRTQVVFNMNNMHLFDPDTEKAIR
jgi:multiple sugar transport system ATP-binding protein